MDATKQGRRYTPHRATAAQNPPAAPARRDEDLMEEGSTLRRAAASGVKWTSLSAGVVVAGALVRLVLLSHLLTPRQVGLAAIALVVTGFATSFADGGISMAIIAKQTTGSRILSTLYWSNVGMGLFVFLLLLVTCVPLARLFGEPALLYLIPVAALVFVIAPFGQQFQVLLERDLQFERLAKIEVAAYVTGTCATVAAAAVGFGSLSIILGVLVTNTVTASLLVLSSWRRHAPTLHWRRSDLSGYLGFGMYQMGERSMSYLGQNIDYLLVGGFLGPSALGIYTLAYQAVVVPQTQINPILTRVAFPIFAKRREDNAALRRGFLELCRFLAFVSLPILAGLAIVAPEFVPALFGERWSGSIVLIQILSILGVAKALGNPIGSFLLAKGRADFSFWATMIQLVFVAIGVTIGTQFGLSGAAWGHVIAVLLVWAVVAPLSFRIIELPLLTYFHNLARPAALTGVMSLVVLLASIPIGENTARAATALVLEILVGAAAYFALLLLFERRYLLALWRLVKLRGPAGSGSGGPRVEEP